MINRPTDGRPNFFIIGAPKSGTTSLAAWLTEHPQLFMCPVKEPCYFNTDHHRTERWTRRKYEWLFRRALPSHLAIGEASIWYLFSRVAVTNITTYCPNARFIVCLRNPLEMAPSLHEQQVFAGNEHVEDFQTAWRLRDERMAGRKVAPRCSVPVHLAYGYVCLLGEQLERLYRQVDRQRVHTVLLDDMAKDPRRQYLRLLTFLRVDDDGRRDFPRLNEAKERRSQLVRRAVQYVNKTKAGLGIPPLGTRTWKYLNDLNRRPRRRKPLRPEMQSELAAYFQADVQKLAALLDRDLDPWLARSGSHRHLDIA